MRCTIGVTRQVRLRSLLTIGLFLVLACGACAPYATSDVSRTIRLRTAESYGVPESQISVSLLEADPVGGRALLRIQSGTHAPDQGWVRSGDYATFSQLTGRRGLQLLEVGPSVATLRFRSTGNADLK